MDSRNILLDTFRDNNAQLITAADMRELINAIYDEKVSIEDVIDNLLSIEADLPLSANQGRILKVLIDSLQISLDANIAKTNTNETAISELSGGLTTTFNTTTHTITLTNGIVTSITPL